MPQRLAFGFDEKQAEHVDPWTLTVFEVEPESRSFTPLENSRVDVDKREVTAWVDHPGTYGLIGLPKHPGVLETLRLLDRYGPQLLEERDRGEHGLQDRICGLILCEDPTMWGGGPIGPGDLCALCLGLDPSFDRLPERFLLERQPPDRLLRRYPEEEPEAPGTPAILAWGRNYSSTLGDGTSVDRRTPVWVVGLSSATKIVGGANMTIALNPDGTVWIWGLNAIGHPGPNKSVPGRIAGLTGVVDIAAGYEHALAVRSDGSVWRWGIINDNASYDPSNFDLQPVQVAGLSNAIAVAAGIGFSLALTRDPATGNKRVWSWGSGNYGTLGDGSGGQGVYRPNPALVPSLTAVRSIAAGWWSAFAVKDNGDVVAWGLPPLGDGGSGSRTPVPVPGLSNVEQLSGWHGLARTTAGEVWTWGRGDDGETGDGTFDFHPTPVRVPGLQQITGIAAGGSHCLAMQSNGTVWAWGSDEYGQVGDGGVNDRTTPFAVPLPAGRNAAGVGAGADWSFAILG